MSEPVLLPHPVVGGAFTSPVAPGAGWPDDPGATQTTYAVSRMTPRWPSSTPG
jgi:hypothetical protein